eukprot:TRINITY_DN92620_c0_g1_i1.p1 TRINITY_DN92620_c0_g1~~TRINITY_DN92620_c0_g1_i1.p1  ORF type:complete len:311 (-),score=48.23 TRINITY_DN92620_c0_g1_i1:271-1119(-)
MPSQAWNAGRSPVATLGANSLSPHAYTALPIAAARTVASENGQLHDPLARKLLAGATDLLRGAGGNVDHMIKRCTIGDELCSEGYNNHGVRQVVSIGAGMDSRAFRLGMYEATFFEVDSEDLFSVKEPLVADVELQAAARKAVIGRVGDDFDLRQELISQGFDPMKPSVWLLEGLVSYLTAQNMVKVAGEIGSLAAPGSALWFDGFSKSTVSNGRIFYGVPYESGFDDYDELLRNNGFKTAEVYDAGGVYVERGRVIWDRRWLVNKDYLRGRGAALMIRAFS